MIDRLHVLHVPGADPQRDEIVNHLQTQTEVCLHADPERGGIMPNWMGAVACATRDTSPWSVIVQDDAMPVGEWEVELASALVHSPEPILGLTYFGNVAYSALRRGVPYLVGPHLIWGGAVAYRHDVLMPLHGFASMIWEETRYQHDDRLISAFAQRSGHQTALTCRAIFDQPVEESLVGHAGGAARRPAVTVATPGIFRLVRWSNTPRFIERKSGAAADQREWLVRYGTDDPTPYSFEMIRSGYVRKVER